MLRIIHRTLYDSLRPLYRLILLIRDVSSDRIHPSTMLEFNKLLISIISLFSYY